MKLFGFLSSRGNSKKKEADETLRNAGRPDRQTAEGSAATSSRTETPDQPTETRRSRKGARGKTVRPRKSEPLVAAESNATPRPTGAKSSPEVAATAQAEAGVIDALDQALGGEVRRPARVDPDAFGHDADQAAVLELFSGIAANQARPVKNLIFELQRGTATKEWIEICRPIVGMLVESAQSMGLSEAAERMADFDAALALGAEGDEDRIDRAAREMLLESYRSMAEALPDTFELGEDQGQRESVIIHSLLKQVPDVGHVTFERLYGAGVTTLEALFQARQDELEAATGIPGQLCERICKRLQQYRSELVGPSASGQHRQLAELLDELRREHAEHERAAEKEWTDKALTERKRAARQRRQLCALKIEVLLAEMGELDLVDQVRKQSFDQRIETLAGFLASVSAAGMVAATPNAEPELATTVSTNG